VGRLDFVETEFLPRDFQRVTNSTPVRSLLFA
jgi:hypothetical protein